MRGDFFFFRPCQMCSLHVAHASSFRAVGNFFVRAGGSMRRSSRYRSNLSVPLSRLHSTSTTSHIGLRILAASLYTLDVYRLLYFFLFSIFTLSSSSFFFFTFAHFRSILPFGRYKWNAKETIDTKKPLCFNNDAIFERNL